MELGAASRAAGPLKFLIDIQEGLGQGGGGGRGGLGLVHARSQLDARLADEGGEHSSGDVLHRSARFVVATILHAQRAPAARGLVNSTGR